MALGNALGGQKMPQISVKMNQKAPRCNLRPQQQYYNDGDQHLFQSCVSGTILARQSRHRAA
eukprot:12172905-Ditylum_brightwellii.AAC.1